MKDDLLTILQGDSLERLRTLADESVQCCVTSPPYFGLRNYGVEPRIWLTDINHDPCRGEHDWQEHIQPAANGIIHDGGMSGETLSGNSGTRQAKKSDFCANCGAWRGHLGLEPTPELYVQHLVSIFREIRRVLRKDGALWLNLGDSYAGSGRGRDSDGDWNPGKGGSKQGTNRGTKSRLVNSKSLSKGTIESGAIGNAWVKPPVGYKCKDLIGIPWMVAFALRSDGWWLRSDIPWIKRNTMPESTRDRPTKAIEYFFLLTKSDKYFYDYDAVRKPAAYDGRKDEIMKGLRKSPSGYNTVGCEQFFHTNGHERWQKNNEGDRVRARRNSDWFFESLNGLLSDESGNPVALVVNPSGYADAHFATYPPDLIKPCILAGSRIGDTIIDPFAGSGTSGMVALELGRKAILIELNPSYVELIKQRCDVTPGLPLA